MPKGEFWIVKARVRSFGFVIQDFLSHGISIPIGSSNKFTKKLVKILCQNCQIDHVQMVKSVMVTLLLGHIGLPDPEIDSNQPFNSVVMFQLTMDHHHSALIQIQTWQDPESPAIARPVFNTVSYLAFYKSYILYPERRKLFSFSFLFFLKISE